MDIEPFTTAAEDEKWMPLPSKAGNWLSPLSIYSGDKLRIWTLVLSSRNLKWKIERFGVAWHLYVPENELAAAFSEIARYEAENLNWPPNPPQNSPTTENLLSTLSVLILLAAFHNITNIESDLFGYTPPDWFSIGKASAARILDGEWWRLLTSLTLHSDVAHLASNILIGGFFVVYLCKELGAGLAWFLLLLSASCGNLLNAYFNLPTHNSIGSSTLVFAAVGILASITLVRNIQQFKKRWFIPIASAMAILVSLGTEGKHTDLGAHFFGFLTGSILGFASEILIERLKRPGRVMNALFGLTASSAVIAAWWVAIKLGS